MRWWSLWLVVFLVAAFGFGNAAIAQDGGDIVLKKDGKWLIDKIAGKVPTKEEHTDGKIVVVKEEFDYLHYRFRAVPGTQRIPMDEVDQVFYHLRDQSYDRGVRELNAGKWEEALESFQAATTSGVSWVPQYAMWQVVRILEGMGRQDEALAAIEELTRKFSKSKYLVQALIKAGQIRLANNDPAGANREFAKLRGIPGVPDSISDSVDYYAIYVREIQAGTDKSRLERVKAEYEALLSRVRGKNKEVETKCSLGIGRCLVKLEKHAEALDYFQNILKDTKDPEVLAGAYLMIGEAYFHMEKWVEARRAYLRVCVLWDDQPEMHAQALCRAGNCFLLARDGDFKNRARQEFGECINRYPGSYWAKEAESLAGQIK